MVCINVDIGSFENLGIGCIGCIGSELYIYISNRITITNEKTRHSKKTEKLCTL